MGIETNSMKGFPYGRYNNCQVRNLTLEYHELLMTLDNIESILTSLSEEISSFSNNTTAPSVVSDNGEKIDTIPNIKCPNCLERKMIEDDKFGEQLKEIEAFKVTHNSWEILEDNERKEKINQELRRQGYLE